MIFSCLIIEDDPHFQILTKKLLEQFKETQLLRIAVASTEMEAIEIANKISFDVALIDLSLHGELDAGIKILKKFKENYPLIELIAHSSQDSFRVAQACIRAGASDYLLKGYEKEEFFEALERALERKRWKMKEKKEIQASKNDLEKYKILGTSSVIQKLHDQIDRLALSEIPVLLEAETGSGKELVARNIHLRSLNPTAPFVAIDCASIPSSMAEGYLFGHEKGAFTGALSTHEGVFEQANGGTLFLDEISSLALELQTKFLRVLQEKEFRRVGGTKLIPVNFRLLAAANQSLEEMVEKGVFKADLYYRLQAVTIKIPPLRERKEDLLQLLSYFAKQKNFSTELLDLLREYSWPGNIRECKNLCMALDALAGEVDCYEPHHLPESILKKMLSVERDFHEAESESIDWKEWKGNREKEFLHKTYFAAEGNISKMARLLKVDRSHLFLKLKKLGIHEPIK